MVNFEQSVSGLFRTLLGDLPEGGFMGGHLVPEISCKLCNMPVDLSVDLSADENGKAVHEDCYAQHITNRVEAGEWAGRVTDPIRSESDAAYTHFTRGRWL